MSTTNYKEIVGQLDALEPMQMAMLMGELQRRMVARPKYRLEEFLTPSRAAQGSREDWVGALRAEWDDRG